MGLSCRKGFYPYEFVDGIESVIIGVDRDRKFNPINWYLEQRAKNYSKLKNSDE